MATLILAQKKLFALPKIFRIEQSADCFLKLNEKGVITVATITLMSFFALVYLVTMYITFDTGFRLQAYERSIAQLQNSVASQELKLQELRLELAGNYNKLLPSMEKISSLKYITEDNFTASLPVTQP